MIALKKVDKSELLVNPTLYDSQKHSCLICLQLLTDPVECKTCHALFCTRCLRRWSYNSLQCPKKCSPTLKTTKCQPTNLQLKCLFNCGRTDLTCQTIQKHMYEQCESCPVQFKKQSQAVLKANYLCNSGHPLQYLGDPDNQDEKIQSLCTNCELLDICRNYCEQCKASYCCCCRHPKGLTDHRCPLGHKFQKKSKDLDGYSCDYCGKQLIQEEDEGVEQHIQDEDEGEAGVAKAYNDQECDLAICRKCYETNLPKDPEHDSPIESQEEDDEDEEWESDNSHDSNPE